MKVDYVYFLATAIFIVGMLIVAFSGQINQTVMIYVGIILTVVGVSLMFYRFIKTLSEAANSKGSIRKKEFFFGIVVALVGNFLVSSLFKFFEFLPQLQNQQSWAILTVGLYATFLICLGVAGRIYKK